MEVHGKSIKEKYILDKTLINLNSGSYGTCPNPVLKAKECYLHQNETCPDRYTRIDRWTLLDSNVKAAASFFHADLEGFGLVDNCTSGMACAFECIPYQTEDEVLVTNLTYETVAWKAEKEVQKVGGRLRRLKIKFPLNSEDELVEMYEKALNDHPKIRIAVLDHIAYRSCMVFPLERLIPLLQSRNIIVIVDGAHAAGQIHNLNLSKIKPDFYVGNLHKWFYTARSLGFISVAPKWRDLVRSFIVSWNYDDKSLARRLSSLGTRDWSSYFTVTHAIDFIEYCGGLEAIHKYIDNLMEKAVAHLVEKWDSFELKVPTPAPSMRFIALPIKFNDHREYIHKLRNTLDNQDWFLACWKHTQCTIPVFDMQDRFYVRLSVQIFNSIEDIHHLADKMLEWLEIMDTDK